MKPGNFGKHILWNNVFLKEFFAQKKGISLAGITHAIKAIQVKGHS